MPQARDFFATGSGVVALVFSILGLAFLPVGAGFAIVLLANKNSTAAGEPTWVIAVAFLSLGAGFAAVGFTLGWRRIASLRRAETLRKYGMQSTGTITSLDKNASVRVNRRHPWIVRYDYSVSGMQYHGAESTFDVPAGLKPGAQIAIRYDGQNPRQSALDLK
jgi:Protein of unknown function (DUF3592)